jgi:hypothetical protein
MLKKFLKCAAFICAMSLTLSLYGCSDTSWAVKVGTTTVPSGVYLFWLTQVAGSVTQNASSGTDPWSQTISGTTAVIYASKNALDYTEQCGEIENLCAKMKITSTSNDKNSAIAFASSQMSANSSTYSSNGISSASLQRVYEDFGILRNKLFTAIYGTGGTNAVADTDIKSYYTSNFVKIKHIVVLTSDATSGTALTGDALTKANNTATAAFNEANVKGANFDALMVKYSQDTPTGAVGAPNEATGYIFSKSSAATNGFDSTFISTAFSMKVGAVEKVQTSYGWDIMYKLQVDQDSTYYDANKASILSEMKSADFDKYIQDQLTKDKPVQNDAAINYYNPKKLK